MRTLPPLRPGTVEALPPFVRWLVIVWLVFTVLGLLFVGAALIWTGWWASPGPDDEWALPQKLIPLLAVPIAVAVIAYGVAIWRAWRREPTVRIWLVGLCGHLAYLVIGAATVGEVSGAAILTWDNLVLLCRLFLPGLLLLNIERSRLENPLQP